MQKGLFILLWLLLPVVSFGQNLSLIDSIKTRLRKADGAQRYNLLNDLAWEYRFAFPDSTIFYADQAYRFADEELNLLFGLARSVNLMGVAHNYKGERLTAFEYFTKALEISTRQKDSVQIAHSNNNLGRLFYEQGLLSRSYNYFMKARIIFLAINDSSGVAYTYQSLGNLYKSQRDYENAEDSYLKAYSIRLALRNTRDIMSALLYIGRLYLDSDQPGKSVRYLQLADSAGHAINDEINLAEIKTFLAESYLKTGRLADAEAMDKEALAVILKRNNLRMMPQAYSTLGQVMLQRGDLAQARKQFTEALHAAGRMKDLNATMDAYYYLWQVADRLKDQKESLSNHNQYLILKDSIQDLDLTRQVERLQFEMLIQRKEQENELLKLAQSRNAATIEQQRLQNIILAVIVAGVSIIGALQWLNAKRRRAINEKLVQQNVEIEKQRKEIVEQNEKLSRRNQQLSELNHEKDTLMGIVAHDLKSPLNRIDGVISLIEMDEKPDKVDTRIQEYLGMIKDATHAGLDLITDLLDVHMLEENVEPAYSSFDISKFLLEKTEYFTPLADAKKIHLNITRVESEEVFTDKTYLDRIVENLLSNAIKFSSRDSDVEISADRTAFEFWIKIKDHGPGFSAIDKDQLYKKFKKLSARPTAGESSNGLGLAIVKILVDRLKGKIELVSEHGKGSEFTIRFPQQKQYA